MNKLIHTRFFKSPLKKSKTEGSDLFYKNFNTSLHIKRKKEQTVPKTTTSPESKSRKVFLKRKSRTPQNKTKLFVRKSETKRRKTLCLPFKLPLKSHQICEKRSLSKSLKRNLNVKKKKGKKKKFENGENTALIKDLNVREKEKVFNLIKKIALLKCELLSKSCRIKELSEENEKLKNEIKLTSIAAKFVARNMKREYKNVKKETLLMKKFVHEMKEKNKKIMERNLDLEEEKRKMCFWKNLGLSNSHESDEVVNNNIINDEINSDFDPMDGEDEEDREIIALGQKRKHLVNKILLNYDNEEDLNKEKNIEKEEEEEDTLLLNESVNEEINENDIEKGEDADDETSDSDEEVHEMNISKESKENSKSFSYEKFDISNKESELLSMNVSKIREKGKEILNESKNKSSNVFSDFFVHQNNETTESESEGIRRESLIGDAWFVTKDRKQENDIFEIIDVIESVK